jgi:D-alanine-D-alanine ligase
MVLDYFKVPTAPYAVVQNNTRLLPENPHHSRRAALSIASSPYASSLSAFPLFIKPCAEGTGKGITPSSKITNPSELETVTRDLCERFPGQDILIEPFLVGREHTVGIVGTGDEAIVIGITEASFTAPEDAEHLENPGFLTYETKTDVYSRVDIRPCSLDDPVIREVADVSVRAWKALGCRDGGRVDVRLDGHGPEAKAYVMEVYYSRLLSRRCL